MGKRVSNPLPGPPVRRVRTARRLDVPPLPPAPPPERLLREGGDGEAVLFAVVAGALLWAGLFAGAMLVFG